MAVSENIVQSRRALYVGGIGEDVHQTTLRAAMIPFGPIKSVDIVSVYRHYKNHLFVAHCIPHTQHFLSLFPFEAHGLPKGSLQGIRLCGI